MIGVVDIGGTKTAVGLVQDDGTLVAHESFPTAPDLGLDVAMARVVAILSDLSRPVTIDGIGVAATGPIDPQTGRFGNVGLLPGWQGQSVLESLHREFNLPIVVENDADAGAIGELTWGSGRGRSSLLYVTVSTGIGAGYVRDGRVVRDTDGQHPEMGHHVVKIDGPVCYCGRGGCWEALASGSAVARFGAQTLGVAPSSIDVGELLAHEPPSCAGLRERTARYLGVGLANLISILRPEVIALGGGLMGSWELLCERVLETVDEHTDDVPRKPTITLATHRPHTALIGAAAAYLRREEQS